MHHYLRTLAITLCLSLLAVTGASYAAGNYRQTCHHCQWNGARLSCTCLDQNQYKNRSTLRHANRCSYIENINGRLTCTGGKKSGNAHRRWIPSRPIMNNYDAKRVCPTVCHNTNRHWNGQWRSNKNAFSSTCQCVR